MTRKDVMDAVKATEPGGTPSGWALRVIGRIYPHVLQFGHTGDRKYLELIRREWKKAETPVWSAFWEDEGRCGFVSRIVVNDPTTFLSTDSQGRDRRLPVAGKTFYVLAQKGG